MARRNHREIWFGMGIGLGAWAFDSLLHANGSSQWGWSAFIEELFMSDGPRLLFRILFLIVSLGLGYSLWLSRERERRMRDLEQAIRSLERQIVNPSLLIAGYSSAISLKEGWPASREAVEMISAIHLNAQKINEALKQWPVSELPRQAWQPDLEGAVIRMMSC